LFFDGIEKNESVGISVSFVYNQEFCSDDDFVSPIFFGNRPSNKCEINEVYVIKAVDFYDLLDPNVIVKLSVTLKGKAVIATDGTEMKRVSASRDYEIVFTDYGNYTVEYTYADHAGNSSRYSFVVAVKDLQVPTLEFKGELKTDYKVGDEIRINDAIITDNVSAGMKLKTYHYLLNPDGTMIQTEVAFKVDVAGTYVIYYYVVDEAGNVAIYSYEIYVR
jgi:hypothetical protein